MHRLTFASAAVAPIFDPPVGFSVFNNQPGDVAPVHGSVVSQLWLDDGNNGTSVTTDVTSPCQSLDGNTNVLTTLFSTGLPGGSAPCYIYIPFVSNGFSYKKLCFELYFKCSANFQNAPSPNTGTKLLWPAADQVQGSQTYVSLNAATADLYVIQQGGVSRNLVNNLAAAALASRFGQWERLKFVLGMNTDDSTADGTLDVYYNTVHVTSYTDVNWQANGATGSSRVWQSLAWNPTYGGGPTSPPVNMNEYIDHLQISGQ